MIDPGTKLGPYEIQSPLGMGEFCLAKDSNLDRHATTRSVTGACLRHDNHTMEDPGAYPTVMTAACGEAEANSKKKNPPTGTFYHATEAGLMGNTVSSGFSTKYTIEVP